jgi:paraquat-inducible protein A
MSRVTATSKGLASCHLCQKVASAEVHECPRCGSALHRRKTDSINRTLALVCTACLLYIPANIFPIMITDQMGHSLESTILGGVVLLIKMDSIPVAAIIFIASVMVPVGKLISLSYLCWTVKRGSSVSPRQRSIAYRITELIGKWSMMDVFVVSILVALVHIGKVLVIRPGVASIAFAALVIVTMVAAEQFDPRLFWDPKEEDHD